MSSVDEYHWWKTVLRKSTATAMRLYLIGFIGIHTKPLQSLRFILRRRDCGGGDPAKRCRAKPLMLIGSGSIRWAELTLTSGTSY